MVSAEPSQFTTIQGTEGFPGNPDLPGTGHVKSTEDVEQGCFPGSGRPHDGSELSTYNTQINVFQCFDLKYAFSKVFAETFGRNNGFYEFSCCRASIQNLRLRRASTGIMRQSFQEG